MRALANCAAAILGNSESAARNTLRSLVKKGYLTDRKGITFPVRCDKEVSYLYNSLPTYLGDKQQELKNFDYLLLEFTVETKEEAMDITRRFALGDGPDFPFTRGLYRRGVE